MKELNSLTVFLCFSVAFVLSERKLSSPEQEQFLKSLELDRIPKTNGKKVEIPDFIREEFFRQTGLHVETTTFLNPGAYTGFSNTLRLYKGSLISEGKGLIPTETVVEFQDFKSPVSAEAVEAAYLKVYWNPKLSIKRKKGTFKAKVYDIIQFSTNRDLQVTTLHDVKLIHSKDSELDQGWYTFEITEAVIRWVQNSLNTTRLLLERGRMKLKKFPNLSGIIPNGNFTDAHLLLYYEDDQHKAKRMKRSAGRKKPKLKNQNRGSLRRARRQPCKRHEMYVDFEKVGWNDWIVAPQGYDAFKCIGECRFPLPDHLNGTNHAIVQTLVNGVNPSAVPQACCVPTELSKMSMLYHDEYERVTLKNYDNMVVEGCGCR